MNSNSSSDAHRQRDAHLEVPRDRVTDDKLNKTKTPAPDRVNIRDEDYADHEKPLVAGSPEAKALHDNPPKAKGELGVGTAGDAARPSKPGIHGKPIPPRQSLRRH